MIFKDLKIWCKDGLVSLVDGPAWISNASLNWYYKGRIFNTSGKILSRVSFLVENMEETEMEGGFFIAFISFLQEVVGEDAAKILLNEMTKDVTPEGKYRLKQGRWMEVWEKMMAVID